MFLHTPGVGRGKRRRCGDGGAFYPSGPAIVAAGRALQMAGGLGGAILLATAALVVGIISITRPTATPVNPGSSAPSPTAAATADTTAADPEL